MRRKNWHWDLNLSGQKIRHILAHEDDPRFPRLAGVLLARVHDPKQVFECLTPEAFCRRFRAIEKVLASDEWTRQKAAFWKTTYLRLSKELQERGVKIRKPARIVLDEFDQGLIGTIKACRTRAMMSQRELAQFIGCSQQ